jgi:uncharacterized protein (DUF1800 family)
MLDFSRFLGHLLVGAMVIGHGQTGYAQTQLTRQQAFRFLNRATFGPTRPEVDRVQATGYNAWLDQQFAAPRSVYPADLADKPVEWSQDYFYKQALEYPDQLRQRVTLALHKIFVVSAVEVNDGEASRSYLNALSFAAFENVYVILKYVALHPAMGTYLNMVNNDAATAESNVQPNENFARELLQLFSLGLTKLNRDGTAALNAQGAPQSTYTEADVKNVARALTGWIYAPKPGEQTPSWGRNQRNFSAFMVPFEPFHDHGAKTLPEGLQLAASRTAQEDLDSVIDMLFAHPNLAPFLSKQFIQQLVTSNPSPAYVARVVTAFENNGQGVRGDMKAILRAILLDPEALTPPDANFGHLKEPALLVTSLIRPLGSDIEDHPVLSDAGTDMGQKILFPPSVFSYFSPSYRVPRTTVAGPEFQILTAQTALYRVNFVARALYGGYGSYMNLHLDRFIESAKISPDFLITVVDDEFLGGTMSPEMRQAVRGAVISQLTPEAMAKTALYLVATSAQFQVVR